MTVYYDKARQRWRYTFVRDGERHAGYCLDANGLPVASRRAAVEAESVEKRNIKEKPKVPAGASVTLAQIVAALKEKWKGHADWPNKQRYLREAVAYFGPNTLIASISPARLEDYVTHLLKQPVMIWHGGSERDPDDPENAKFWKPSGRTRSAATVNRYLPVVRAIFARAYKTRDPITDKPVIAEIPEIAELSEPKRKARPIPDGVLTKVMEILPPHVTEATIASLLFGFRRSEIFHLEIKDVDFEMGGVWLNAAEVKDDEDDFLPGAPEAMDYLKQLVDQAKERGVIRLITWQRKRKLLEDQAAEIWRPVERPKTAWRTAMKQVEKAFGRRYRWHDIRAAFITHVAITSGPVAAQSLARHSDFRTTQGYIAVADDVRRAAATRAAQRPALAILQGGKQANVSTGSDHSTSGQEEIHSSKRGGA